MSKIFDCTECENYKQKQFDNEKREFENCDNFLPNNSNPIKKCFWYLKKSVKVYVMGELRRIEAEKKNNELIGKLICSKDIIRVSLSFFEQTMSLFVKTKKLENGHRVENGYRLIFDHVMSVEEMVKSIEVAYPENMDFSDAIGSEKLRYTDKTGDHVIEIQGCSIEIGNSISFSKDGFIRELKKELCIA